jgi:hypothetical protein
MSNEDITETEISVIDSTQLNESYIEEMITEKSYECISESLSFIHDYTYEKSIPIAEKLTYGDLFEFFFEE